MRDGEPPCRAGLAESGWVDATPPPDQPLPMEMLKEWIDESYRAQAPKKLVAQLDAQRLATAALKQTKPNPVAKISAKKAAKKTASKRPA